MDDTQFLIREANKDDLQEVLNLDNNFFEYALSFGRNLEEDKKESQKELKNRIISTTNNKLVLVVQVDDEVIGYLTGHEMNQEKVELGAIFINQKFQLRGFGSKLIKKFISWCMEKNIQTVVVKTFDNDKNAIEFYLKNKFKMLQETNGERMAVFERKLFKN